MVLIGIFSHSVGPSLAVWANPAQSLLEGVGGDEEGGQDVVI
jgi:hypothetical protein